MLYPRNHHIESKYIKKHYISLAPIDSFHSIDILPKIPENVNTVHAVDQNHSE